VRSAADTSREGWLYASAAYAALIAWALLAPLPAREPPRPATRIRLVAPAPTAAEPPPPAPAPPPRPEPPRRMEASRRPAPEPLAPPPLVSSAPPPAAPAPRRFTVSMEATVPAGGVAVPVASSGSAANPRGVPGAALEGPSEGPPALEPDRGPSLLSQPGAAEMRALYPDAARRAGIEGDVRLELVVSAEGEVLEVRVVRPAGNGFDEVAEGLVRRFRFRPATSAGRPVPARIPWTYKFRLEG